MSQHVQTYCTSVVVAELKIRTSPNAGGSVALSQGDTEKPYLKINRQTKKRKALPCFLLFVLYTLL